MFTHTAQPARKRLLKSIIKKFFLEPLFLCLTTMEPVEFLPAKLRLPKDNRVNLVSAKIDFFKVLLKRKLGVVGLKYFKYIC